jgi:hypothetical protein
MRGGRRTGRGSAASVGRKAEAFAAAVTAGYQPRG